MRNMQFRIAGQAGTGRVAVLAVVGERDGEDRCVDDDQRSSRSARRCDAAVSKLTCPPLRPPARARTSRTVGRSASSLSVARRYSCSDMPASAARRRSTACVLSGRFRTCSVFMATNYMQCMQYATTVHMAVGAGGPTIRLVEWRSLLSRP
jgi:hypothetical protein